MRLIQSSFYRKTYLERIVYRVPVTTIQTRTVHFPVNERILYHCPHLKALLAQPPDPTPLPYQKGPISLHLSTTNPGNKTLSIENESPVLLLCLIYHCYDSDASNLELRYPYIEEIEYWGIKTIPQLLSLFDLAIRYSYTDLHRLLHSYLIEELEDEWDDDEFPVYLLNLWQLQTFQSTREGVAFRDEVLEIGTQHYETLQNHEVFRFLAENVPPQNAAYILWKVRGDSDGIEAWYPGQWWNAMIEETWRDTDMRMRFWNKECDCSAFREVEWDQPARRSFSTPVDFLAFEDIGGFFGDEGELSPRTLSFPDIPAFSVAVGGGSEESGRESGEEVKEEKSRINPCRRLRKWCFSIRLRRLRSS